MNYLKERDGDLFSNADLKQLIVPLLIEQLLAIAVGMADSIMVSSVGEAAVSSVSLIDTIFILLINMFTAIATGGAVVCGQYIGKKRPHKACEAADQLLLVTTALSVVIMAAVYLLKPFILHVVFGNITAEVERNCNIYLMIVAASIPFLAVYNGCAAIFRAQGDSKTPMKISIVMNLINISGNALLVYALKFGVDGVAIPTLLSRMYAAVAAFVLVHNKRYLVRCSYPVKVKPDFHMLKKILGIGIPNGLENSMFQLGKLAIQSTVSTLGTAAIAAQAMTNILENLNGIAAIGVGVGLMTIVGQCLGAGRKDEAVYYIKKLCVIAEIVVLTSCLIVFALTKPVTILGGMEKESADMCFHMVMWITIMKPLVWTMAFVPGYGLRAAGDVKFSMITSCCTMWACRFCLCVFLIRVMGFGPMSVWIGMFADWTVRSIIFTWRFHSRKWLQHKVI